MREFIIAPREAGQRADKYVQKVLDKAPKNFIYKMIRKKTIVLNDRKMTGQELLRPGDSIKIYFSEETFAKFSGIPDKNNIVNQYELCYNKQVQGKAGESIVDIVYEDADILIINKPAGLLSQKAAPGDDSANDRILRYLLESGQLSTADLATFHPSICNRLDRNTSGLLIAGKTMHGLQEMAAMLKDRSVQKFYRCLVWGDLEKSIHLSGYLIKDSKTNRVRIVRDTEKYPNAAFIETACEPIAHYRAAALLEVHLITGRSHQIRAHLASIGHPILGDPKYGDPGRDRELAGIVPLHGQLLHAYRMELPDGRTFVAPEPEYMKKVMQYFEEEKEL